MFTHICLTKYHSNQIIMFANNSTIMGLTTKNDKTTYKEEVIQLVASCKDNNLSLNVSKTKKMIVDFRRTSDLTLLYIIGCARVETEQFQAFGYANHKQDLTWFLKIKDLLLPKMMHVHTRSQLFLSVSECISPCSFNVCYGNCSASDRKAQQHVVKSAQSINGSCFNAI